MSDSVKSRPVIIIGAGMAGLTAGRRLHDAGQDVIVLDKGRGVGGRMATRRIQGTKFDHGAQFFTIRDQRFLSWVEKWQAKGIVSEWSRGFPNDQGKQPQSRHPRYKADQGMTAIPKALAEGLDIRLQSPVKAVCGENDLWQVQLDSGQTLIGGALIMTAPIPQSMALLSSGGVQLEDNVRKPLEGIVYNPCLALMVLFSSPSKIPQPGGLYFSNGPLAWMADNRQKGVSDQGFGVTLHAGPDFSREKWRADEQEVAQEMLIAGQRWLNEDVIGWQLQRWRYSQPQNPYPQPLMYVPGNAPLIFAGDAFDGPRVEGAFLSGYEAAQALMD